VEDPLGEVDEGVAVGVGGEVSYLAEAGGESFERNGGVVGGTARGLVVEVPENDDLVAFGGVNALGVLHHVDFHAAALDSWVTLSYVFVPRKVPALCL